MWFPLHCSFIQLCCYWKSLFRGCFLRWSSWGPGREEPWLCWRHKPVPSGLSRSFLSLWLWQLWKIRVEGVLSQSCWWEVMATKIGPLTLESPHILLNLTLLLQQEKLHWCSQLWRNRRERKGKLRRFLQMSQETEQNFGLQEAEAANSCFGLEQLVTERPPLCTGHAPLSSTHGQLCFYEAVINWAVS